MGSDPSSPLPISPIRNPFASCVGVEWNTVAAASSSSLAIFPWKIGGSEEGAEFREKRFIAQKLNMGMYNVRAFLKKIYSGALGLVEDDN